MIIVAGESLMDMLPVENAGRRMFLPAPGGSPFNVAMALGRLGAPVKYLCRISQDPFGALLAKTLEESHVDLSLCPRTAALSTLGFVMLEGAQRAPNYVFYTEQTAGCGLEPAEIPERLPAGVLGLHFGSISMALNPICDALERLLSIRESSSFVSVDPNIRPFLVRDRQEFVNRLERFLACAHLIKLSEEDLAWLHPDVPAETCCRRYLARGAGLVIVTRGARGALGMNRREVVEVPAESVQVADTVGAGDTFQAALLAWLFWKHGLRAEALPSLGVEELRALLRFGVEAAAITCSRPGCDPPWRSELNLEGDSKA